MFAKSRERITYFETGQDWLLLELPLWDGNLIPGDVLFLQAHLA